MLSPEFNLIFKTINVWTGIKSTTISLLCALLYKTGIKAVQEGHKKSQVHRIQGTIRLNCHFFQMSDKKQGVIFA